MASTRTRQRKLARERYQRQMTRRALQQRRRRQIQAGLGAFLVLVLVVAGAGWLAGWFDPEPDPSATGDQCQWQPLDPTAMPDRLEVGTPPTEPGIEGPRTMTVELDAAPAAGTVQVALDTAADPCAAASMEFLAAQSFYDGTGCHELTEGAALACGDPSGTGVGGPTYAYFGTNLPVAGGGDDAPVAYPAGTVALADDAGRNSSQFLIFFEDYSTDQPIWPVLGEVTAGLEVVQAIGTAGTAEGSTAPAEPVTVQSLTVTDPAADAPPTGAPAGES